MIFREIVISGTSQGSRKAAACPRQELVACALRRASLRKATAVDDHKEKVKDDRMLTVAAYKDAQEEVHAEVDAPVEVDAHMHHRSNQLPGASATGCAHAAA